MNHTGYLARLERSGSTPDDVVKLVERQPPRIPRVFDLNEGPKLGDSFQQAQLVLRRTPLCAVVEEIAEEFFNGVPKGSAFSDTGNGHFNPIASELHNRYRQALEGTNVGLNPRNQPQQEVPHRHDDRLTIRTPELLLDFVGLESFNLRNRIHAVPRPIQELEATLVRELSWQGSQQNICTRQTVNFRNRRWPTVSLFQTRIEVPEQASHGKNAPHRHAKWFAALTVFTEGDFSLHAQRYCSFVEKSDPLIPVAGQRTKSRDQLANPAKMKTNRGDYRQSNRHPLKFASSNQLRGHVSGAIKLQTVKLIGEFPSPHVTQRPILKDLFSWPRTGNELWLLSDIGAMDRAFVLPRISCSRSTCGNGLAPVLGLLLRHRGGRPCQYY